MTIQQAIVSLDASVAKVCKAIIQDRELYDREIAALKARIEELEKRPAAGDVHDHYHTHQPSAPFVQPLIVPGSPFQPSWVGDDPNYRGPTCEAKVP